MRFADLLNIFFRPGGSELTPLRDKDVKQQVTSEALFGHLLSYLKIYNGKTESGKNRADWIDPINQWMGIPLGSAYCLSGILYLLNRLETIYQVDFGLPKIPSTQRFWTAINDDLKLSGPEPYTIGIMRSKIDSTRGHAVLALDKPDESGWFNTFEFNTDLGGSRDGDGAMFTKRHIDGTKNLKFVGFVRLSCDK